MEEVKAPCEANGCLVVDSYELMEGRMVFRILSTDTGTRLQMTCDEMVAHVADVKAGKWDHYVEKVTSNGEIRTTSV